jgi:hypothetical protein
VLKHLFLFLESDAGFRLVVGGRQAEDWSGDLAVFVAIAFEAVGLMLEHIASVVVRILATEAGAGFDHGILFGKHFVLAVFIVVAETAIVRAQVTIGAGRIESTLGVGTLLAAADSLVFGAEVLVAFSWFSQHFIKLAITAMT